MSPKVALALVTKATPVEFLSRVTSLNAGEAAPEKSYW